MKKEILLTILKKIETNKKFRRKLKIFVAIAFVGFFIISGLTVWMGFKAFNYVATKTKESGNLPVVQGYVQNLNSDLKAISKDQVISCWGKTQSLMTIQAWLEKPALDNLIDLKDICLSENLSNTSRSSIPQKQENN